jgi:U4/U6.U5 tri-snRNP-associated protein 1
LVFFLSEVLAEDGDDVLMNINIMDDEAAKRNLDNKKKRPDYNPYDVEEVDEYGMLKEKEVLSKYDEVIGGEQKKSFQLGAE